MGTTYLGLDIRNSMFGGDWTVQIVREVLSIKEAKARIAQGVTPCFCLKCPRSFRIMKKMLEQYKIEIPASAIAAHVEDPEGVCLAPGDSILVLDVKHLEWFAGKMKRQEPVETDKGFVEYSLEDIPGRVADDPGVC